MHSVFRDDKNEHLSINRSDFEGRLKMEALMAANDKNEIDRLNAWNELDEYVNMECKQGGMLVNIQDTSLRTQVSGIKTWRNGTKDKYCEKLKFLRSYVDRTREQIRISALNKLTILILENMKPGGMLNDPKLEPTMKTLLSLKNATAEEYNDTIDEWTKYIINEKERRAVRKQVHDLIARETKHSGMLTGYNNKTELTTAKNYNDGTTDYYTFELKKWNGRVEKERERCQARTNLHMVINAEMKAGGLLDREDWKETMDKLIKWHNGTIEEYTAELNKWKLSSEKERDRRCEMRKLHRFITDEMKPGGMLDEETLTVELNGVKSSKYLTIEECTEKLVYWQKSAKIVKENRRGIARKNLCDFIVDAGGLLDDPNYTEELKDILAWSDGTLVDYETTLERFIKIAGDESKRRDARNNLNDYIHSRWFILKELNLITTFQNTDVPKDETLEFYEQELHRLTISIDLEDARRKDANELLEFITNHSQPSGILDGEKYREKVKASISWANQRRTTEEYKAEKLKWSSRVDLEIERCNERKILQNFIADNSKAGGTLNGSRFSNELERLNSIDDGTTEFYRNETAKWDRNLQKESRRQSERQKLYVLLDANNDIGGILSDSKYQEEMLQIRNSSEEPAGVYINERQKWNKIITTEQICRDEAHKKLLDFYAKEMKGEMLDTVREELKFTKNSDHASVEEYLSELEKWELHVVNRREALRIEAQLKMQSFIESLHKNCLNYRQKNELHSWFNMMGRSQKFYTEKLEEIKRKFMCMDQEFFTTKDVAEWQSRFETLIVQFGATADDELRKILENGQSLLTLQVPKCRSNHVKRNDAKKIINDLLKNAEDIIDPSFLGSFKYMVWSRRKSVKDNFEKLNNLISSIHSGVTH